MEWSEKDLEYLMEKYNTKISLKEISHRLNRSVTSIKHKAARIGLSRINTPINKSINKNHRINYDKNYYEKNKNKIYLSKKKRIKNYKEELIKNLGGKCSNCGYNKCIAAFDFHHKRGIKEGNLNELLKNSSKEKILKEAKKCILLCANCHRELHYGDIAQSG